MLKFRKPVIRKIEKHLSNLQIDLSHITEQKESSQENQATKDNTQTIAQKEILDEERNIQEAFKKSPTRNLEIVEVKIEEPNTSQPPQSSH